jgi:hypothetical protein
MLRKAGNLRVVQSPRPYRHHDHGEILHWRAAMEATAPRGILISNDSAGSLASRDSFESADGAELIDARDLKCLAPFEFVDLQNASNQTHRDGWDRTRFTKQFAAVRSALGVNDFNAKREFMVPSEGARICYDLNGFPESLKM